MPLSAPHDGPLASTPMVYYGPLASTLVEPSYSPNRATRATLAFYPSPPTISCPDTLAHTPSLATLGFIPSLDLDHFASPTIAYKAHAPLACLHPRPVILPLGHTSAPPSSPRPIGGPQTWSTACITLAIPTHKVPTCPPSRRSTSLWLTTLTLVSKHTLDGPLASTPFPLSSSRPSPMKPSRWSSPSPLNLTLNQVAYAATCPYSPWRPAIFRGSCSRDPSTTLTMRPRPWITLDPLPPTLVLYRLPSTPLTSTLYPSTLTRLPPPSPLGKPPAPHPSVYPPSPSNLRAKLPLETPRPGSWSPSPTLVLFWYQVSVHQRCLCSFHLACLHCKKLPAAA